MKSKFVLATVAVGCWLATSTLAFAVPPQSPSSDQSQASQSSSSNSSSQPTSGSPASDQSSQGATQSSQTASSNPSGSAQSSDANQRAVTLLNTANQGEIDMGNTMQSKAQNQQVKDFAKSLVDDHQKAQDQLKQIADKDNLKLETDQSMQQDEQQTKDKINNAQGSQADNEFLSAEAKDHQQVISQLQSLQGQVTDPQLKSYISQTLPTLQNHLSKAQQLQSQIGSSGSASNNPSAQADQSATTGNSNTSSSSANADNASSAANNTSTDNTAAAANNASSVTTAATSARRTRNGSMPATASPLALLALLGSGFTGAGWLTRKRK